MNPVLRQFLTESSEGLERVTALLLALEREPDNLALVNDLFRVVHTIKGNSGLFDFPALTQMVHAGEDLLDEIRDGLRSLDTAVVEALLTLVDVLHAMLDELADQDELGVTQNDAAQALTQRLRALGSGEARDNSSAVPRIDHFLALPSDARARLDEAAAGMSQAVWAVVYEPEPQCFFKGEDPLLLVREMPGTAWLEILAPEPWAALESIDPFQCQLRFLALSHADEAALQAHFRCVSEQVSLQRVDPWQALLTLPEMPDNRRAGLRSLAQAQRDALAHAAEAGHRRAIAMALKMLATQLQLPEVLQEQLDTEEVETLARLADLMLAALQPPPVNEVGSAGPVTSFALPATAKKGADTGIDAARAGTLLRVEQGKVDRLMELVGEMVVAKNALPYLAQRAEQGLSTRELVRDIKALHANINRIAEEMQDAVMQIRMVTMSTVMQRFPRLVRDIANKLDKQVRLELVGEDTEADKTIVEALADPLIHVVRNSLDHGLEPPDERVAKGKPAEGTLRLSASQQTEGVVIEVRDDGRGIDPDRVVAKAVAKGLIDPERAAALTPQQAVQLVFLPGFSTAEQVSDLSGRGVGMDVVRSAVERLRGKVELQSFAGQGTLLRMTLPLSVAVSNVMLIRSAGQAFGIPMDCVVETVRLPADQVRLIKDQGTAVLRGRLVPLHGLNQLLGLNTPPIRNEENELAVLLIRVGADTVGLIVDDFESAMDLILKPFEGVLAQLGTYAGTALLGDGSVLMVLNPKELF